MQYLYDGVLTNFVADWIKSLLQQYPHVLEISKLPDNWNEWQKTNMNDYKITEERSGGSEHTRETKLYALLSKTEDTGERFIFFKTAVEKSRFMAAFGEIVTKENPFKTIV